MIVPGSNLLAQALGVIAPQGVSIQRWTGRAKNANGDWVTSYAAPVTIAGSLQAVSRTLYVQLGLDMAKNYVMLYTTEPVKIIERDGSGDRVTYGGKLYQGESAVDWRAQDGWGSYLFVEVVVP